MRLESISAAFVVVAFGVAVGNGVEVGRTVAVSCASASVAVGALVAPGAPAPQADDKRARAKLAESIEPIRVSNIGLLLAVVPSMIVPG
jgi:hypothetical protein